MCVTLQRVRGVVMKTKHFISILLALIVLFTVYVVCYSATPSLLETSSGIDTKNVDKEFTLLSEARKKNKDVYAWIKVDGTKINYPIVQHETDDRFYLSHDVERNKTIYGAVFTEKYNTKSFTDSFSVVYAHAMRDGSMFGSLRLFKDEDFFAKHRFINIWHIDGSKYRYEIISAYQIDNEHFFSRYNLTTTDKLSKYLNTLEDKAKKANGFYKKINIDKDLKIIALSTCNSAYDSNRYVVQGVLKEVKK